MFRKVYNTIPISEDVTRHIVAIEDEIETIPKSQEARIRFYKLLQLVLDTPELAHTGGMPIPDLFTIKHNGDRWVFSLEAEEKNGRK